MKLKFDELVENNKLLMIVSLLLAIIMWMSIAYGVDNGDATRYFNQIPVEFDIDGSVAGRLGLSPLLTEDIKVRVTLVGNRSAMNGLSPEDIAITANLAGVTQSGSYDIRFESGDYRHKGFEVVNIQPASIKVNFDRIISTKLPVIVEISDVSIPEGFILNQEIVNPQSVTITGPSEEIAKIDTAVVKIKIGSEVKNTSTFTENIVLYDSNGEEIRSVFLDMNAKEAIVTLPVYKKREVPITVDFLNMPTGFNLDSLNYSIDPTTMEIAGPIEIVDYINEISLGSIDMKELTPDSEVYYSAILPDGVISIDNINDALVSFRSVNYDSKSFKVSDIRLVNAPKEYDISINTKMISGVTVYGPEGVVSKINAQDIVAEIDISDVDVRVGQMMVPVDISFIGEDRCWAFGEYSAVITVKERSGN